MTQTWYVATLILKSELAGEPTNTDEWICIQQIHLLKHLTERSPIARQLHLVKHKNIPISIPKDKMFLGHLLD